MASTKSYNNQFGVFVRYNSKVTHRNGDLEEAFNERISSLMTPTL